MRIVSATNRDLIADVKAGRFREDLFYRLHVYPIAVPPLRRRPEDIPELARHFLARVAAEEGKRVRALSGDALALIETYRWPGNVRQLENTIFRAVVLAEGEELGVNEFPQIAALGGADAAPMMIEPSPAMAAALPEPERPTPALTTPSLTLLDERGNMRALDELEREAIRFAIAHYRGQMSEVARRLKIGRSTLYRKLEGLGLDDAAPAIEESAAAQ